MSLAWGGHSNGRIPASALMRVPWASSHLLERSACLALVAVNTAYRAEFGVNLSITDSYRPFAVQERIFRQRYVLGVPQGTGDVRLWNGQLWYLRRGQASASVPGKSNHGWAKAVDLGGGVNRFGTRQHQWMRQWADDAGWVHPYWAHDNTSRGGTDEPWHFEYPTAFAVTRPVGPYRPGITLPDLGALPAPLQPLPEDDMYGPTEHAEVMARFAAVLEQATAAAGSARDAVTRAAAAEATAARAQATAAEAVAVAGRALEAVRLEGDEQAQRVALLGRQLADVKARMPRATRARYDRPGVETYADLATVAAAQRLTYADLTPALIAGQG